MPPTVPPINARDPVTPTNPTSFPGPFPWLEGGTSQGQGPGNEVATNLGLHPARFGARKLVAPSVLLLRTTVINILFVVLDKRLKSNHILLVKPLMLFT